MHRVRPRASLCLQCNHRFAVIYLGANGWDDGGLNAFGDRARDIGKSLVANGESTDISVVQDAKVDTALSMLIQHGT